MAHCKFHDIRSSEVISTQALRPAFGEMNAENRGAANPGCSRLLAGFFEVRTVVDGVKIRLERRLQAGLPAPELMQNERH